MIGRSQEPERNYTDLAADLTDLCERADKLQGWAMEWQQTLEHRTPAFHYLVNETAALFYINGWRVTAAKSSRAREQKHSPFVEFVYAVMEWLPKEIREHCQSKSALAKAIAPLIKSSLGRFPPRPGATSPATDVSLAVDPVASSRTRTNVRVTDGTTRLHTLRSKARRGRN